MLARVDKRIKDTQFKEFACLLRFCLNSAFASFAKAGRRLCPCGTTASDRHARHCSTFAQALEGVNSKITQPRFNEAFDQLDRIKLLLSNGPKLNS